MNVLQAVIESAVRTLHQCYKRLISPLLGNACRFDPSCSDYALQAVEKYGILRGGWLTTKRVLRCNPYFRGGDDPLP